MNYLLLIYILLFSSFILVKSNIKNQKNNINKKNINNNKIRYNYDLLPSYDDLILELDLIDIKPYLISSGFINSMRLIDIKQNDFNFIIHEMLQKLKKDNKNEKELTFTIKKSKDIINKIKLIKDNIIIKNEEKIYNWNYFNNDWYIYYKNYNNLNKFDYTIPPPDINLNDWKKRSIYKTSSILLHTKYNLTSPPSPSITSTSSILPITNYTLNTNYRLLIASIGSPPPYGVVPVVISNEMFQCRLNEIEKRLKFYSKKLKKFKIFKKNEIKKYIYNYIKYKNKLNEYNIKRYSYDIIYQIKFNLFIRIINNLYKQLNFKSFFRNLELDPYNISIDDLYKKYKNKKLNILDPNDYRSIQKNIVNHFKMKKNLLPSEMDRLKEVSNSIFNIAEEKSNEESINTIEKLKTKSVYVEDDAFESKRDFIINEAINGGDKMSRSYEIFLNSNQLNVNKYSNFTLKEFYDHHYHNISFINSNYYLLNSLIKNELLSLNITQKNILNFINFRYLDTKSKVFSYNNNTYSKNYYLQSSLSNSYSNTLYNYYYLSDNTCLFYSNNTSYNNNLYYLYYYPNDFCYNSTSIYSLPNNFFVVNSSREIFNNGYSLVFNTYNDDLFIEKYILYNDIFHEFLTEKNINLIIKDIIYSLDNFDSIDYSSNFPNFPLYFINLVRKLENFHNVKLPKKPIEPIRPMENILPEIDYLSTISEYNITKLYNILNGIDVSNINYNCIKFNLTELNNSTNNLKLDFDNSVDNKQEKISNDPINNNDDYIFNRDYSQLLRENKTIISVDSDEYDIIFKIDEESLDIDLDDDEILKNEMEKLNLIYPNIFLPSEIENEVARCEYTHDYDKHSIKNFELNNSFFLPYQQENYNNSLVILFRGGGCNFIDKAIYLKEQGARGIIVINNSTQMPLVVGGGFGVDPSIEFTNLVDIEDFFVSMISLDNGMKLINDIINNQLSLNKYAENNNLDFNLTDFSRFNISILPEYCPGGFLLCSPVLEFEKKLLNENEVSYWGEIEILKNNQDNPSNKNEKLFYLSSYLDSSFPLFNEDLVIFKSDPYDACTEIILPEEVENNFLNKKNFSSSYISYNHYVLYNSTFPQIIGDNYIKLEGKKFSYGIIFNDDISRCSNDQKLKNLNKSGAKFGIILNDNNSIRKENENKSIFEVLEINFFKNILSYIKNVNDNSFLNYLPILSLSQTPSKKLLDLIDKQSSLTSYLKINLNLIHDFYIQNDNKFKKSIRENYYLNFVYLTNELLELNKNNFLITYNYYKKINFYNQILANFLLIEEKLFNDKSLVYDKLSDFIIYFIYILKIKSYYYTLRFFILFILLLFIGLFVLFFLDSKKLLKSS